jgi:geranylgeranyl pyrophosphate synthase
VQSVNQVFGNKLAILGGDFLLSRASISLARLRNVEVRYRHDALYMRQRQGQGQTEAQSICHSIIAERHCGFLLLMAISPVSECI